jgi:hypothetical protein
MLDSPRFSRLFEVHSTAVTYALKYGYTVPNIQAKAGLLVAGEEEVIIQWVRANSHKAVHAPRSQILSCAAETFKKPLSRGWVHSLVLRRKSELWETQSQPQEESKLIVPREFLGLP